MNSQYRTSRRASGAMQHLTLGLCVLILSACSTLRVGSDRDSAAHFSTYKSFALMQRSHNGVSNPLVPVRVSDAIKADLSSKGYVQATNPATADFTVDFTVGVQ